MYRGRSQKYRQMRFSGACVMHTCESYRERRKTCELFRALTVVTTEKFTGNGESGKKARKKKQIHFHFFCQASLQTRIKTHQGKIAWWEHSAESSY